MGTATGCAVYPGNLLGDGQAQDADTQDPYQVSGPFSRWAWAATFAQIVDGTSNTIMVGEILPNASDHGQFGWASDNANWFATTAPINYPTSNTQGGCNSWSSWNTSNGFKSKHVGGAHFLLCDGSVTFLSENINYTTYQQLGSRRDGQVIGAY
jgi:prepilin-type processing-associated H-X9-DG protein